jgi:hypothetical protein
MSHCVTATTISGTKNCTRWKKRESGTSNMNYLFTSLGIAMKPIILLSPQINIVRSIRVIFKTNTVLQ